MPKPSVPARKRTATPADPGGGKSAARLIRDANTWRDGYNPLRGLAIARVVTLIEQAERGDFAELQLVMRKAERRYPVLKGLKARRLAAIEKLDWQIKTIDPEQLPSGATEAMAKAQQQHLRARYELVENLTDIFGFLVTAEFRGYAIAQKHRHEGGEHDGAVRELHWIPQDQFSRAGQFGDFFYNKDSRFGAGGSNVAATLGEVNRIGGTAFPRSDFIIREVESPLFEIAMIAFVNWLMGRKDWSAFVEIFGLAKGVVTMPPNIPKGREEDYRAAAQSVSDGVAGAIPNGASITFPTSNVRGEAPFKVFCDAHDSDVVLAGTGGRLAMLTADKGGLGDGPSAEHADAFDEIAQADARKINLVMQRDFDAVELAEAFPGQPVLAYFELCSVEEDDATSVIANIAALKGAGYAVSREQIEEKTGYELEEAETPPAPPENPEAPIKNRATTVEQEFIAAVAEKRDPVLALLNRIVAIQDDAQMMATLEKFLANADAIATAVAADPTKVATALAKITAPALAQGLAGQ